MNKNNTLIALLIISFFVFSCKKKYIGENSIETVKYNKNSVIELDSIQTINNIITLKLQEIYDLATNYAVGNKDSDIDQTIYNQIQEYFKKPDTAVINPIIRELDSLKSRFVKINNVESFKYTEDTNTLDCAKYNIDYYDVTRKYLGSENKYVQYTLKETPAKEKIFKQEFKFYFIKFSGFSENDSILSGKIR